jgi:hypothetical protein
MFVTNALKPSRRLLFFAVINATINKVNIPAVFIMIFSDEICMNLPDICEIKLQT